MGEQVSTKPGGRSKQTGSVLIVAMISILSVGAIAAGTNAVLTQDAVTANEKTRALQGMSVADALRLRPNGDVEAIRADLDKNLYGNISYITSIGENSYDGGIEVGSADYGYSLEPGSAITDTDDLLEKAPNIENVCEEAIVDGTDISIVCTLDNDVTVDDDWTIITDGYQIDVEFNLQSYEINLESLILKGSDVTVKINGENQSATNIKGSFAAYATDGDATIEVEMGDNKNEFLTEGDFGLSGKSATLDASMGKNSRLEFSGDFSVISYDGDSTFNTQASDKGSGTSISLGGRTSIEGKQSLFEVSGRVSPLTFDDDARVIGHSGAAKFLVKSELNQKEISLFRGNAIFEGNESLLEFESIKKIGDIASGSIFLVSESGTPRMGFKNFRAKPGVFDSNVYVDGKGSIFEFTMKSNAQAKFTDTIYTGPEDLEIKIDGKGEVLFGGGPPEGSNKKAEYEEKQVSEKIGDVEKHSKEFIKNKKEGLNVATTANGIITNATSLTIVRRPRQ